MGRPRTFDIDVALDRAMHVFWRQGYEGTSIEDLTEALGIGKPSLYAAFGNKRALFDLAVERYAAAGQVIIQRALAEPVALDAVRGFLRMYVEGTPDAPNGCFLVQGALACSPAAADVREAVTARRRVAEGQLAQRLVRAQKEGELPADAKPAELARYVCTVAHGLAVQAAGGATVAQRRRVADIALQAWPTRAG